jgi:hypothetical protein
LSKALLFYSISAEEREKNFFFLTGNGGGGVPHLILLMAPNGPIGCKGYMFTRLQGKELE